MSPDSEGLGAAVVAGVGSSPERERLFTLKDIVVHRIGLV